MESLSPLFAKLRQQLESQLRLDRPTRPLPHQSISAHSADRGLRQITPPFRAQPRPDRQEREVLCARARLHTVFDWDRVRNLLRGPSRGAVRSGVKPQEDASFGPSGSRRTLGDPCRRCCASGWLTRTLRPRSKVWSSCRDRQLLHRKDPAQWHTRIPTFARVRYQTLIRVSIWSITAIKEGWSSTLWWPRRRPKAIRLGLEGGGAPKLDAQGNLVLSVRGREIRFHKPRLYQQEANGRQAEVSGQYVLKASRQVGFHVASYDRSRPLIIDPILSYSTYLGTSSFDQANGIAVDSNGNAYMTGFTASSSFPTTSGSLDRTFNGATTFLSPNSTRAAPPSSTRPILGAAQRTMRRPSPSISREALTSPGRPFPATFPRRREP